jgi:hypothetical protein
VAGWNTPRTIGVMGVKRHSSSREPGNPDSAKRDIPA